jgi:hypothetical protein
MTDASLRYRTNGRYGRPMRLIAGAVLVVLATGCGGGSGHPAASDKTTAFVAATRSAWTTASAASTASMSGEQKAASAWSAFAFTVGHLDPGADRTQQGQLVTLAQQAASAYSAHYAAFICQTDNSFNAGYQSPATCPPSPATGGDEFAAQIKALVEGL